MSDVNRSKIAPELNQWNFGVAVGVAVGVVLTATHTTMVMSKLFYNYLILTDHMVLKVVF